MQQIYDNQALYTSLKELEIIDPKKLDMFLAQSQQEHVPLDDLLVKHDLLSVENAGKAVAELLDVPYISLSASPIPESAITLIPESYARAHNVIVFADEPNQIKLAMNNPTDKMIPAFLQKKAGKKVSVYYATRLDLEKALRIYRVDLQTTIDELIKGTPQSTSDAPIEKIVDTIISFAYAMGTSDIHLEPEKERAKVRFRIDGVMHTVLILDPLVYKQIISRVKVLSRLRTDEHFSAQDGKMQVTVENESLDIRVSIVPIAHGENAVLRLLASHFQQFGLHDLGMSKADYTKVEKAIKRPHGMVVATGPTGSGKSTTIYSVLKILNTSERNIATIEDPIEYDVAGINQIQVNTVTDLTFANGLRSILRQDPDIIYVGEIRDNETADIAINSAMTGHLVLSTLHTNDAVTSIPRLTDMNIEPFLISSTLQLIIAQRLVRKICIRCKVSYNKEAADLEPFFSKELYERRIQGKPAVTLYKGKGCTVCHQTGYSGRIGIFEILEMSDTLRELITDKASSDVLLKQAKKEGMMTMTEDGLEKVLEGLTTIEEVLRTTRE